MDGQQKILSMWAFTQIDVDDTEGVVALLTKSGEWVPLVGADLARVHQLMPIAQMVADETQQLVTLVHFSARSDDVTLSPQPAGKQVPRG